MKHQHEAYEIIFPDRQTAPVVFASPHSGCHYPADFLASSPLEPLALKGSEDAFVDQLFASASAHGAPMIKALFPRAYVDANRDPWELDPKMFKGPLPGYVKTSSSRLDAGLGTIPKNISRGLEIYDHQLEFEEIQKRIIATYMPYHEGLQDLITRTKQNFGSCLLIDCHSMPSLPKGNLPDIVLGDGFGKTVSSNIFDLVENTFRDAGYSVDRNNPYAGGFSTSHYGKPETGIHALQIEINRGLYMDQKRIKPLSGFNDMIQNLSKVIKTICAISALDLSGNPSQDVTQVFKAAE